MVIVENPIEKGQEFEQSLVKYKTMAPCIQSCSVVQKQWSTINGIYKWFTNLCTRYPDFCTLFKTIPHNLDLTSSTLSGTFVSTNSHQGQILGAFFSIVPLNSACLFSRKALIPSLLSAPLKSSSRIFESRRWVASALLGPLQIYRTDQHSPLLEHIWMSSKLQIPSSFSKPIAHKTKKTQTHQIPHQPRTNHTSISRHLLRHLNCSPQYPFLLNYLSK